MLKASLFLAGIRFFLHHPWQLLLALISVAIGSSVMIAVDLANESARLSFSRSVDAVAGNSTHRIVANQGIDESFYTKLRVDGGFRKLAPIVEGQFIYRGEHYLLLGVDPFAAPLFSLGDEALSLDVIRTLLLRPRTFLTTQSTAERLGLDGPGDTLPVHITEKTQTLELAAYLPSSQQYLMENVLLADIGSAQEILSKQGFLDRIELQLHTDRLERLRGFLDPRMRIEPSRMRSQALDQMTAAFRTNLSAMSLLAVLISAFLVYNTIRFTVIQRRQHFAVERMLGVTGRQLAAHIFIEALVLAAVGALAGCFLGVILGQGLLILISRAISDLYTSIDFSVLTLQPLLLAKGLGITLLAVLLAAVNPALEAARVSPVDVHRRSSLESAGRRYLLPFVTGGAVMAALSAVMMFWAQRSLLIGFAALFLMVAAYSLCIPILTELSLHCLNRLGAGRNVIWSMAVRGIQRAASRINPAITALTIAVSATVGVGIMISSFRVTVDDWLSLTLQSDIYVSAARIDEAADRDPLDVYWQDAVRKLEGVRSISTGTERTVFVFGSPVPMLILQAGQHSAGGFRFLEGESDKIWDAFQNKGAVLVSEPLAWHHRLKPGDSISLSLDSGPEHSLTIAGVYQDYSATQGMLVMAREHFSRLWFAPEIITVGLYLDESTDAGFVRRQLSELSGDTVQPIRISSNREIRDRSLKIFDRTFAITEVLRLLVLIVAFVGVFSALMALYLEKSYEYAVLRATGMTQWQLSRLIFLQTCITGSIAGLLALPLGWLLSEVLIHVINKRSFGWSMYAHLPLPVFIHALVLSVCAALAAAVYPVVRIVKTSISTGLRNS